MRILLLEDELMLNTSICEYIKELNHTIDSFTDGSSAYSAILESSYDLLILDINVPEIDGFELLKKLHAEKIYIPTIYISALIDIDDISKAYDLGCSDYIKKPFHLKELSIRIKKLVETCNIVEKNHIVLSQNYTYSTNDKILYFQSIPQTITKRQLDIIDLLAKNIGFVVDFDTFRSYVYNDDIIDNPTIRAEIKRLRDTLKDDFIINIRGLGYKIDKFYKN
jgi:DNA-binding response OmpR family regulator